MIGKLEDFITDTRILDGVLDSRNKLLMVIGAADTGKTALIECLSDYLSRQADAGIVDLDMGQSHISLPASVAWGKIKKGFRSWQSIRVEDYYFTGAFSPVGSLLPAITGAKLMTDRAAALCEKVVIDTSGLIAEPAGRLLKQFKIDILSPDIILALEHTDELGHILGSYQRQTRPKIYRLSVPEQVGSKSREKRGLFRLERFRSYFAGAHTHEVFFNSIGIRFTREPMQLAGAELKNRVVSFRNAENRDIALGIIKEVHAAHKKFLIKSPIQKDTQFSTMIIGEAEIEL